MSQISFDNFFSEQPVKVLGVVGSREWPNRAFVESTVQEHLDNHPTIDTIVSGGQPKGVDGWAAAMAKRLDLTLIEHLPAHWYPEDDDRYGSYQVSNYFARNSLIAADADLLLAFCYQKSKGTLDTYKKARNRLEHRAKLFTEAAI